jgi:hypothetical protein
VTYRRSRRWRLSPREQSEKINAHTRFYAAAIDDPQKKAAMLAHVKELPPKRHKVVRPCEGKPSVPLEKEVLAAALDALRSDPRVWIVDRRQSGVFQDGDRYIRVGQKGHLDISGMLHGGKYFEIEAKRPGEKPNEYQLQRIEHVKRGGGISGYFTSVESALALLP